MKRKKSSYTHIKFKMPYIYLEDIKDIEDIISNDLKGLFRITVGEYEYDSIDEAMNDQQNSSEVKIASTSPYLSLDLKKSSATLFTYEDNGDLLVRGCVSKISEIIKKRERKTLWALVIINRYSLPWLGLAYILSYFFLGIHIHSLWPLMILVLIIVFTTIGLYGTSKYSVVNFRSKNLHQNFITRNKDNLIMLVISNTLSLMVGIAVGIILAIIFQK